MTKRNTFKGIQPGEPHPQAEFSQQKLIPWTSVTTPTSQGAQVPPAGNTICALEEFTWFEGGILGTWTSKDHWYPPAAITLLSVRASVDTAPTGAAIIIDILKNGTTIFTNTAHRPQIAVSTKTSQVTVIDVSAVASGDELTFQIVQVGSTVTGSDLAVTIGYQMCFHPFIPNPPLAAPTNYRSAVLADNPLAYWRLGESSGTSAADETGHGHTAAIQNVTWGQTGALAGDSNTAALFSSLGINDTEMSATLDLSGTHVVTFECWWKNPGSQGWQIGTDSLLAEFHGPWFSTQPSFIVDPNYDRGGGINAFLVSTHGNVGFDQNYFTPTGFISLDAYHHYVFVFDFSQPGGSETKAYVDGSLVSLTNLVSANNTNANFGSGLLTLMYRTGPTLWLAGDLDEPAIYAYELPASRVLVHYNAGIGA